MEKMEGEHHNNSSQTSYKFSAIPIKISLIHNNVFIKLFMELNMLSYDSHERAKGQEQ